MMRALAKVGFSQSYTYFTWRNTKAELIEYLTELMEFPTREYFRPNFFTNTPDILPVFLQEGGRPAFRIRLVLAATLSPAYGIYNGFELCENTPIPEREEYLHSEKYEYKVWDWDRPGNIKDDIRTVNRFRRANPALHELANLRFVACADAAILAYLKISADLNNTVIVIVNLDPFAVHEADLELPLAALGIDTRPRVLARGRIHPNRRDLSRRAAAVSPRSRDQSGADLSPASQRTRPRARMSPPDDAAAALPFSRAAARPATSDPLWYKDAIIYQLHVKAFFDADDDGIGDFRGLCRKLDYLQDLGVTALWLLPFYPSPLRDDGYDISDYKNINPAYGRMHDFKAFVREAHRRDLRVITELVINHTSDQHPWFQRARHAKPGSHLRDFYVWSDTDQKFLDTRVIFVDTEKSNWAWDPVAQAYYWHRFYSHQPDLNFDNPRVFRAVVDVMRFWLDLGVDGLAARRGALSDRARGHDQREPARDPRCVAPPAP